MVSAMAPEVITYDIEIVYYATPETEAEVVANVEGTGGAIDRYNEWQVGALGRDINPTSSASGSSARRGAKT